MKENKRMNLLTMEHITKAYTDRVLLNDVAFSINENEKIGVIGINGMGKSTLLKVAAGIEPYDEGKISIGNQVKICYLPQTPEFEEGTTVLRAAIADNVNELNQWTIEADARSMLNKLGFYDYDEKVEHMSGGQKKRIALVNALLTPADILVLDEPTNGLDPIGIAEVRNFIKDLSVDRGKTILISSHILSEIALLADDIGIIDHGVLLEESSMEDLEKKNRKYIQLQVSDVPKASLILERQFHVTDYAVQDEHNLRLYDTALDMAAINKALVVQDVAVISSQICSDTLEDYFKQITGGEGIA